MKKSNKGRKLGTRPHQWKSGPDITAHASYRAWLQCRNQARFRSEPWDLTFDQWQAHWAGIWHLRGRTRDALCITRRDGRGAWCDANVIIVTRSQHGARKRGISVRELNQTANDVLFTDSDSYRNRTTKS